MKKNILVAGATGQLGSEIVRHLVEAGVTVRALVRKSTLSTRLPAGAEVVPVDFEAKEEMIAACRNSSCIVSALSGLRDVIVEAQTRLLEAAVAAKVPRFIPSDFAIDYTKIPAGMNRNLNLRSEFKERLDRAPIRATSILNGAFTEMLTGQAPFVLFPIRRVLCWGDPNQRMDWTTLADTARYAAHVALDDDAPRILYIAGDQFSANELAAIATGVSGNHYRVLRPGGPKMLERLIRITRALSHDEKSLYSAWQGMQYMHNMYLGHVKFSRLDNDRYPAMRWTTARDILEGHFRGTKK